MVDDSVNTEERRGEHWALAFPIDLPSQRYVLSVFLHFNFLRNWNRTDLLKVRHNHKRYEVVCCWEDDTPSHARFRIIPPGCWHFGRDFSNLTDRSWLCPFTFSIKPDTDNAVGSNSSNAVLERFLKLNEPIELSPAFDGAHLIEQIRNEIQRKYGVRYDVLITQFQLLMLELAYALPFEEPCTAIETQYHSDDFRQELVDIFFVKNHSNPDCCRAQLAKELNISERQVGRVVEQLYQRSFSEVLTEYRMNFAEAWRADKGLTAAEAAAAVGYQSVRGFLKAYKNYFHRYYGNQ